jgi:transposase-like protein
VLLDAFGLSLKKTSRFFRLLSEPLSKSNVEDWTRKVEAKLSFDPKPQLSFDPKPLEYSVIAVDESVVKCGGRPPYVWVAVDAYMSGRSGSVSPLREPRVTPPFRFLRRLRKRCLGNPVILTDRGPWYRDSVVRAGFQNHVHQTFGLRSSVESSATSRIGPGCSTTTSIRRKHYSHLSWTSWSYLCTGTQSGGDMN